MKQGESSALRQETKATAKAGDRGLTMGETCELIDRGGTVMSSKRRQGQVDEDSPTTGLQAALESAITSQGSAELALLYLIDHYDFNLDALKSRMQGSCRCRSTTVTVNTIQ